LDRIGLTLKISNAALAIDFGRKGFATHGKEHEGRLSYERGISEALSAFKEAQATADPQAIILAEYTFLSQELEFCQKSDKDTLKSLTQAIQFFDDAFLVLKIIEDKTLYQVVENSYSHKSDCRFRGFPKDAFHVACGSHKTRLQNIIRSPGIDPIEKALLKQRLDNLSAGQRGYLEKQRKALTNYQITSNK
jgi:hypothetical protein